jgi:uncharacterized protein YkwD
VLYSQPSISIANFNVTVTGGSSNNNNAAFSADDLEMLRLVNTERARVGVGPLRLNSMLGEAADVRAYESYVNFSHTRTNGSRFSTAITEVGYNWSYVGENLAAGNRSVLASFNQWMNSQGHYENMIRPEYEFMGVGYYENLNGIYRYYWVQLFSSDNGYPNPGSQSTPSYTPYTPEPEVPADPPVPDDPPGPDNPSQPDNPTADPNAPSVSFGNVGGSAIGSVAYGGTANISVSSTGTYQLKTSDRKDIIVKVGNGTWTDRDRPSRYEGEQVSITGNCTVTVAAYGSSTPIAVFNVTVGGSSNPSQPDNPSQPSQPDNPTADPNAPSIIFGNVGGSAIGSVAYTGTANISVSNTGTYQIKTSDRKDIIVKVNTGSWTDRDRPSRYEGEQVSINGNCTVTVAQYGSSTPIAVFNVTVGGNSNPSQPDNPSQPSQPQVIFSNISGSSPVSVNYGVTANLSISGTGTFQIKTSDSKDIIVKVGNGAWIDRDRPSRTGGEQVSVTGNCTVTVADYATRTTIATFNIRIAS